MYLYLINHTIDPFHLPVVEVVECGYISIFHVVCPSSLSHSAGSWLLLPGGQDRRHHQPPAGPPEGLLAARSGVHHGGGGHLCRAPRCILPGDSRGETSGDQRGGLDVRQTVLS